MPQRQQLIEVCKRFRSQIVATLRTRADELERPFKEAEGFGAKVALYHLTREADALRHHATFIGTIEPNV